MRIPLGDPSFKLNIRCYNLYMLHTRAHKILFLATIFYIAAFALHYLKDLNYEFLAYVGLLIGVLALIVHTLRYTRFPFYILVALSVWGLLHMMGGGLIIGGEALYAYRLYPIFDGGGEFYILKFDQVVHAALYAVVGLMFYHILRSMLHIEGRTPLVALIAIMASLGVSAMNEIVEFIAVLLVPDNGVGGYYNTALDIVFNFLGAFTAVTVRVIFGKD